MASTSILVRDRSLEQSTSITTEPDDVIMLSSSMVSKPDLRWMKCV